MRLTRTRIEHGKCFAGERRTDDVLWGSCSVFRDSHECSSLGANIRLLIISIMDGEERWE
jgi:hypothetical protein